MEKALWYLLAGTRGGENRARLIRAIDDRPRNANQLSEPLGLEYNTIRYHFAKLEDHDVVEIGSNEYGELYFLSDRVERHRTEFETITEQMEET